MSPKKGLTAEIEPFDSFWEAPEDIEKGYASFTKFYKRNYLKHIPKKKNANILAVSCGPGYFVNLMKKEGYTNVLGIDSDAGKIEFAKKRGLNCEIGRAFNFLADNKDPFDLIFAEQEINHLTKEEITIFFELCWQNLKNYGLLIVHSLNGANPVTGSEALAQNFNHYNTFTEYSLKQVLQYSRFQEIEIFPLKLYIFYENPLNYIGLLLETLYKIFFRFSFMLYGKSNRIFTKKIAAICKKSA